ncbi:hypothetical protein HK102_006419 [Quaeritorhiza haematococci]|nr:hypothetical protein HK102_006419 [Quaeritorhiza haematococci]
MTADAVPLHRLKVSLADETVMLFLSEVTVDGLQREIRKKFKQIPYHRNFKILYIDDHIPVTLTEDRELVHLLQDAEKANKKEHFTVRLLPATSDQSIDTSVGPTICIEATASPTSIPTPPTTPQLAAVQPPRIPSDLLEGNFDVMISYQWDSKGTVMFIFEELKRRNLRVWLDEEQMTGNVYDRMARAVLESTVVLPCLTVGYRDSPNCKLELCYAKDLRKPLVPARLDEGPFEWAALITSGLFYVDLSKLPAPIPQTPEWKKAMDVLHAEIRNRITEARKESPKPSPTLHPTTPEVYPAPAAIAPLTAPPTPTTPSAHRPPAAQPPDILRHWLRPVDFTQDGAKNRKAYVEGTRGWLLDDIRIWLAQSSNKVFWLKGMGGIGKSVMAWLCASRLPDRHDGYRVFQFYCGYNDSSRNDPSRLVCTIAYAMSQSNADLRDAILGIYCEEDQRSENGLKRKSVLTQFERLILTPLQHLSSRPKETYVIVLDAVDECGPPGSQRQRQLMDILTHSCQQLPEFVKVVVTSGSDVDLSEALTPLDVRELLPSDSNNLKDFEVYAHNRLQYQDFTDPSTLNKAVGMLCEKAQGVFVCMRLACDLINAMEFGNDEALLWFVENDLATGMDPIFEQVLGHAIEHHGFYDSKDFQLIIGTICILKEPLTQSALAALLAIDESRVGSTILRFRSILNVHNGVVTVMHKSIVDFFTDPTRCTDRRFFIDRGEHSLFVATKCNDLMLTSLRNNMCGLNPRLLHSEIPDFVALVDWKVKPHVQYACKFWIAHVLDAEADYGEWTRHRESILGLMLLVCRHHLLQWVEVMSLMGVLDFALEEVKRLLSRFPVDRGERNVVATPSSHFSNGSTADTTIVNKYTTFGCLFAECARMIEDFRFPISESALQVYLTALPCCPKETQLSTWYQDQKYEFDIPTLTIGRSGEWDASGGIVEMEDEVHSVALSPDGLWMAAACGSKVVVLDVSSQSPIRSLEGHTDRVRCISWSMDGCLIASGSEDLTVRVWNGETGMMLMELKGHSMWVTSVAFSPDVCNLVSGCSDETVRGWDISTGSLLWKCILNPSRGVAKGPSVSVLFSPDGHGILIACDQTVTFLDAFTRIRMWSHHLVETVTTVTFSPDGRLVVAGLANGSLQMWDSDGRPSRQMEDETIQPLSRSMFQGHTGPINVITFPTSPVGQFIVTGSSDGTIRIWDADGGMLLVLEGHTKGITSLAISADYIYSGSIDATIQFWEMVKLRSDLRIDDDGWVHSAKGRLFWMPTRMRAEGKFIWWRNGLCTMVGGDVFCFHVGDL